MICLEIQTYINQLKMPYTVDFQHSNTDLIELCFTNKKHLMKIYDKFCLSKDANIDTYIQEDADMYRLLIKRIK